MKIIRFVLILAMLPAGLPQAPGREVPRLAVFDQTMLQFMQDHGIPDGQLAMTCQGRLVLDRFWLFADY